MMPAFLNQEVSMPRLSDFEKNLRRTVRVAQRAGLPVHSITLLPDGQPLIVTHVKSDDQPEVQRSSWDDAFVG
jgi:hypothetical protein